ncbi:uncharacterized protein LY89DRAFT_724077 [Mollisia scopiformis]|uniref:Uncharacterized protein n=1 Tax=Mollisia scopiformis TaxID=149040 RepID=A0A132BDB3_MOLSC|nr:uncharacterized protein LY89DRAFT_724077 [Mollisia scopiformis]KUJ09647.1 hypothetical protein LY89DRAFT_724077 [Mollisia scopiformis]
MIMLDPAWLEKSDEGDRMDYFFRTLAPIYALRVALPIPKTSPGVLEIPHQGWHNLFLKANFKPDHVEEEYRKDMLKFLVDLHEYTVLIHARAMHEKLWTNCSEFFLLALAFDKNEHKPWYAVKPPRSTKQSVEAAIDSGEKEDSIDPAIVQACRKELETMDEKFSGLVDHAKSVPQALRYQDPDTFRKMKMEYVIRQKELNGEKCDYSRWDAMITLATRPEDSVFEDQQMVKESIWRMYREGPLEVSNRPYDLPNASKWLQLSINIRAFCLHAGCSDVGSDPLENVQNLRTYVSTQKLFQTMDLYDKIYELETDNREKENIIVCLSFRHLIEKYISDVKNSKGIEIKDSSTRWEKVWTEIWNKAPAQDAAHPMRKLLENNPDPRDRNDIKKLGDNLYHSLSGEIHKYHEGKVELKAYKGSTLGREMLAALTPGAGINIKLDWKEARGELGYKK